MRVLITRPEDDAAGLAEELARRGHDVLSEPLLRIGRMDGPEIDTSGVQAIILTSANGARAAAARIPRKDVRAFAVGATTEAALRMHGFTNVSVSTGQGVDDLARHVAAHAAPARGSLLHVTSAHTAGDLRAALRAHGFEVHALEAYTAIVAQELSAKLRAGLSSDSIDAAMFYSPRTAGTFSALVQASGLARHCSRIAAVTISQNVAKSLHPLIFRKVLVAETTGTAAMLDLLKSV